MVKIIFAISLVLILSGQVFAEMMVGETIEWLTCDSNVVLIGKIENIEVLNSYPFGNCTIKVNEVIKGNIKEQELNFSLGRSDSVKTVQGLNNSKKDVLLFLKRIDTKQPDVLSKVMYIPASMSFPFSIIDLEEPPRDIFSKDMEILTSKDQILKIARQWSKTPIKYSIWIEVPWDSPIHKTLYAGSGCYLFAPAEEKYHSYFIKLASSENADERQKAARELYKFPGKDSEQVLRKLLDDKSETIWYSSADRIQKFEFSVSKAAYESLKILGITLPAMSFEREPTEEEQNKIFDIYWRDSFNRALSEGWKVVSVKKNEPSIFVDCNNYSLHCRIILLPKFQKELLNAEYLGNNGKTGNSARNFFLEGTLPENVRQKLIQYFGLEKAL